MNQNDVEIYRKFQKSPKFFIEKIWNLIPQQRLEPFIKGKHYTWQQNELLTAVELAIQGSGKRRISVRAGHGVGKTTCLSWLIIWFLFCFKDAQVACTAPTSEQMHDVLWKELKLWLDRMPKELANLFEWQSGYLRVKESSETWFARAKTARKETPEALSGVHGDHVLFIIDEASGVPEEIYKSSEGALTGENSLVVMISNPTRTDGYFYDSHNSDASDWELFHFNSEESPIVNQEFVDRVISKYGKDSDEYKIRVYGEFPDVGVMDEKGWIPLLTPEQVNRGKIEPLVGIKKMGIDPSGEGDDKTVWVVRDLVRAMVASREVVSNSASIAAKSISLMEYYDVWQENVKVDNLGVGANVARDIALFGNKLNVDARNWAEEADDKETFFNKRAECYWRLREWIINGGILCDDEMANQVTKIRYKRTLSGKIQIIDKKDLRKAMGKSPDEADALALTFYDKDFGRLIRRVNPPQQNDIYSTI